MAWAVARTAAPAVMLIYVRTQDKCICTPFDAKGAACGLRVSAFRLEASEGIAATLLVPGEKLEN